MAAHDGKDTETQHTVWSPGPRHQAHRNACLVVIHGEGLGRRMDLDTTPLVIGRSPEAGLHIDHASVSRRHCEIRFVNGHFLVRDLKATNRTRLNEEPVDEAELHDGDHLTVGEAILKFISRDSVEARYHDEVYQLATHDALTGLYNQRQFVEMLEREVSRASRHRRELSLCVLDVDLFKPVNDRFGHIVGDAVLRQLAAVISAHVRAEDVAGRIGGEEFAVILPETGIRMARTFAERLREAVANHDFPLGEDPAPRITISIGIAALASSTSDCTALLGAADQAMYRAKRAGRNRVEVEAMA